MESFSSTPIAPMLQTSTPPAGDDVDLQKWPLFLRGCTSLSTRRVRCAPIELTGGVSLNRQCPLQRAKEATSSGWSI